VGEVLAGVELGQQVGVEEIVTLLGARGPELAAVCELADDLRRRAVGDVVTFVRNRNINYTNVCTFKCRFCAFSKGPLSLNLRGDPYLLDFDEIQRRVVEAVECGATEVCLQGGIHPSFDGDYYLEVARAVKAVAPSIHVHGFTALEVFEGARRLGMGLPEYLARLKSAGLATLPALVSAAGLAGMTTLVSDSPFWQSALWLGIVGIGSGMFNSPNTAAMMGTVPVHRRGIAAGARMMLQNTGAVLSIAFVLAIVTAAVPKDVLFKIFSGITSGLSQAKLDPFIHNMHTALWVLAATSVVGAGVSLLRPRTHGARAAAPVYAGD